MWLWTTILSALFLGLYDVAKKQSLKRNGVLQVLLCATALSTLFLCPFLSKGSAQDHLTLIFKALLVSTSWISGLWGMKLLPLTTASTIKATRPVFVLLFSIILFGERLNAWQWGGSIMAICALYLLSVSSRKEGIRFSSNKGVACMALSVVSGAASALYDKHIMSHMEPLFVQSWTNFYITLVLGIIIAVTFLFDRKNQEPFQFDWMLLLIAVLITVADFAYFYSLSCEGAMLSIVSMVRRSSVIVPFIFGAVMYKEKRIKGKILDLAVLLCGMAMIIFGTN